MPAVEQQQFGQGLPKVGEEELVSAGEACLQVVMSHGCLSVSLVPFLGPAHLAPTE